MNRELLDIEINKYLDKYKKYMTKDIYITSKMYDTFVSKYKYLYEECEQNNYNPSNNIKYENILKIKRDKNKLLKRHNREFVDDKLNKYNEYFDNMFISIDKNIKLDKSQKEAVICDEDNLFLSLFILKLVDLKPNILDILLPVKLTLLIFNDLILPADVESIISIFKLLLYSKSNFL